MSILAFRPAVAVPRKSEACPKHGIHTSLKHFFFETSTKTKALKKSLISNSTRRPCLVGFRHIFHIDISGGMAARRPTLVQNPQDVDMEETSRATEKTT